ncbi:hypothetical protein Q3G72_000685 [Acer saccharum]|nr:hypothetical protein Q3G72_000685 [Acer saccharum]
MEEEDKIRGGDSRRHLERRRPWMLLFVVENGKLKGRHHKVCVKLAVILHRKSVGIRQCMAVFGCLERDEGFGGH